VSYAALLLSLCGVAVSVFQTRIMIAQQRAIVWPHLEFSYGNVDGFYLEVRNSGIGPAIVRTVDVTMGDKHFSSFEDLSSDFGKLAKDQQAPLKLQHIDRSINGRTLRAGEEIKMLQYRGSKADLDRMEGIFEGANFGFRIVYSSIHDQCWELAGSGTRQLDHCP